MIDREEIINELVKHIESALAVDSDYVDSVRIDLLQYTVALLKEKEIFMIQRSLVERLHLLRRGDADDGEGDGDDAAHAVSEQEPGLQHALLRALDAADGVEAVEAGGKLGDVLVDAAGVVVPGGQADLLRQGGQLLDELLFRLVGEQGGVHGRSLGHRVPVGGQLELKK